MTRHHIERTALRKDLMAGRQSKWDRANNPGRIILQPRDKEIIVASYTFGFLTREQIQELFDLNCVSKVNLRMRKLYDHRYLSRHFLPTARGSLKAIYFSGSNGTGIIAEKLGIDPLKVRRRQKNLGQFKDLFLNHFLDLNDVWIKLIKEIKKHPNMELLLWLNDHDCFQNYIQSYTQSKKTFRPDGYFRLKYKGRIFNFFVEMDRSTMSNQRFKEKVKSYIDFAYSGQYQKIFDAKYFRVLTIAPTASRMENLKKTVEEVTDKIFWFTTSEKIAAEGLFNPIWYRAGHEGLFPLIEI
jgi:hypothetical protein